MEAQEIIDSVDDNYRIIAEEPDQTISERVEIDWDELRKKVEADKMVTY